MAQELQPIMRLVVMVGPSKQENTIEASLHQLWSHLISIFVLDCKHVQSHCHEHVEGVEPPLVHQNLLHDEWLRYGY